MPVFAHFLLIYFFSFSCSWRGRRGFILVYLGMTSSFRMRHFSAYVLYAGVCGVVNAEEGFAFLF